MENRESWSAVTDFAAYEVSTLGRVRSLDRIVQRTDGRHQPIRGRILRTVPDRKGYLRVNLFQDNAGTTVYVHQLVLSEFVGPRPEGEVARHLNGNQTDNRLENLMYGTTSENQSDAASHGTHRNTRKTQCPKRHAYTPENTYIDGGRRRCRACLAEKARTRRAAKRA